MKPFWDLEFDFGEVTDFSPASYRLKAFFVCPVLSSKFLKQDYLPSVGDPEMGK